MGWNVNTVECIHCLHRWVSVFPDGCTLEMLECPSCHGMGTYPASNIKDMDTISAINKIALNSIFMDNLLGKDKARINANN